MDFKDFFRILISNRDSLSYPEKHMNIIFKFFVFAGVSFIFLIASICVLIFYNDSSKFILDFALIIRVCPLDPRYPRPINRLYYRRSRANA